MPPSRKYPQPGEVWMTDFGLPHPHEPAGRRPAVIVGPITSRATNLPFVFAVPLTTRLRNSVCHIEVQPNKENGLSAVSSVQSELVRSISRERCVEQMGIIDNESWAAIRESIKTLFRFQ